MRKMIFFSLMIIMSMTLVSCGRENQGTYYPDSSEMKANLEEKSYSVEIETIEQNNSQFTALTATKKDEYIEFYWFDSDSEVDDVVSGLETKYNGYNKLVSMKNDSKFGNLAFCSTEKAMKDSGIVIVEVKVKV